MMRIRCSGQGRLRGEDSRAKQAMTENEFYVIDALTGGTYVYGGYPDIDGLFQEQAAELDRKRREIFGHA